MSAAEVWLLLLCVSALVVAFFASWDAAEQREHVCALRYRLDGELDRVADLQARVDRLEDRATVIPLQRKGDAS